MAFSPPAEGLQGVGGRPRGDPRWYNGYRWLGEPVYNPFDVLLLLDSRHFGPHWFETGTPTFLLELLARENVAAGELEGIDADHSLLSSLEVDRMEPEALMFQTGYLTIRGREAAGPRTLCRLEYPNLEVRTSLNQQSVDKLRRAPRGALRRAGKALRSPNSSAIRARSNAERSSPARMQRPSNAVRVSSTGC